jgi:pimeloyl-ACP methyl ester carboxylesterase
MHVRIGGKGPAVVLLHGSGETGKMWTPLAGDLMRDHTVITPDRRGMGLSSPIDKGFDKKNQVHAFELRPADIMPQTRVSPGNARTFEGRDLIANINQKLAALLGTTPDQSLIAGMVVHRPSKQIFLTVHRGRGPDAIPVVRRGNHAPNDISLPA